MQIRSRQALLHRLVHQVLKRYIHALTARIAYIQLDLFNGCDGSRNSIVRLFHGSKIGGKHAPALDVSENKLSSKSGNTPMIREAIAHRAAFVVIVDQNRVSETIFHTPVQNLWRKRKQLIQFAAPRPAVLKVAFAL